MRGVLVAVALVGTCRAACDPCADGLCYTLYSGEDSPSEAEDRCEARGGHLAKVTTAGQIDAVKHVLEFVPDGNCVRFGAILEAGSWRWTDGTAVTAIDVIEDDGDEYCSCYWVGDENVYDAPCYGGWGYGDYYLCATSEGDGSAGCDICDGRGVRCDTVAGYECRTAAGESVGDSNAGPDVSFAVFNTAADCRAAGYSWTTYTKTRLASGQRTRTIGTWVGLAKIIKTSGTGAGRPAAAATRTPPGPSALSRRPATAAPLQAARRTMVPGRGGVIAIWTTTWAARHRRATAGRSVRTRTAIIWWPLTGWTKALAALATANATASAWIASAKTKST